MKSLVISAPGSGAGKTMITLGLLRSYRDKGVIVGSAKNGPDYIDPQFHAAASGKPCVTLDAWAMSRSRLVHLARSCECDLMLIEGAMGLFDGAPLAETVRGGGSTADLAAGFGSPVVLVIDIAAQAQTSAAVAAGLAAYRDDVTIAGVILNRTGSVRHALMARRAIEAAGFRVFGAVPRSAGLEMPSRHLGLVQAREHAGLESFLVRAAGLVSENVDLGVLDAAAAPLGTAGTGDVGRLEPPGQRISVARDTAFAFSYPHLLEDWQAQGATVSFFSPLEDEGPDGTSDAVYLPGGYPELHAGRIAGNDRFRRAMAAARTRHALIYAECGGYMVLGRGLVAAGGSRHQMLDFLPLETSFADKRLHLGYRTLECRPGAPWEGALTAHEFHYASTVAEGDAERLFDAADSLEEERRPIGLRCGRVMGSFAHVIDRAFR